MKLIKPFALFLSAGLLSLAVANAQDAGTTPPAPQEGQHQHQGEHGPKLTKAEHDQLHAARKTAEKDPAVVAAKAALKAACAAKDKSQIKTAREALKAALKAAMLKADSTLSTIFQAHPELPMVGRPEHGGHGERGEHGAKKAGDAAPAPSNS